MRDCLGEKVVRIMSPNNDKMYGWNLLDTLEPTIGTIEFRRGAAALLLRASSFIPELRCPS